jgi:hypothetical protein
MHKVTLFLFVIACGALLAGLSTSTKLVQLKDELLSVQQEEQTAYRDYQAASEMRRVALREDSPQMMQHPDGIHMDTPQANVDDALHELEEREQRIAQYTSDLNRLSALLVKLEAQKRLLQRQIRELEQEPQQQQP